MQPSDDTILKTVKWVNATRRKYGMPPIDTLRTGRVGQAESCSIARSLKNGKVNFAKVRRTRATLYFTDGRIETIDLPREVIQFIEDFDKLRVPSLIYHDPEAERRSRRSVL